MKVNMTIYTSPALTDTTGMVLMFEAHILGSRRWFQDEPWLIQQKCGPLTAALSKSMFDIVMDKLSKSAGPGLMPTSCLCHKEHRTAHISDVRCFSITPRQLSVHPQHTLVMYHTALCKYTTRCPVCADCNGLCFICSGAHFELIGADIFLAASEAADLAGYISFFINCKC